MHRKLLGTYDEEYRITDSKGATRWVRERAYPIREHNGTLTRIVGVIADITENRDFQEKLLQAQRMKTLGVLAAGMAHEINNPLAYAIEFAEELGESLTAGENEEARALLERIKEGLGRIRGVTQGLKFFSRQDAGEDADFHVAEVLESSVAVATPQLRGRATVERRFECDPLLSGNKGKLGQVFLNLIVNAAQACPEGASRENRIGLTVKPGSSPASVLIEISDTGEGIAPENLARIFDPFFTTKPVGVGTGLGLSICREIIEAMGGRISVESTPGQGTTFSIGLPTAASVNVSRPESRPAKPAAPSTAQRKSVLIIEDEPTLLMALERMLTKHHRVETFENGNLGLDHLLSGKSTPDVILCDLMMPGLNGMELFERVRTSLPGVEQRFVFMTGGAFSDTTRNFLESVPNAKLNKPFDRASVLRIIEQA